ncbi:hypothetical protein [Schaalia vaccimaxillae]|uniref:primosomal protein N' family DNA-binding protein n=1 Tax=Schaalia vaccimaxillae TaxID=183916 RepID=UPI00058B477B|nr:hypothetical protein [Schaalia vaccimaxillae]
MTMDPVQDTFEGFAAPELPPALIARVIVDTDLPHLDHPFDYLIPDNLVDRAQVGHLVRIRLAGKRYNGWIIDRHIKAQQPRLESIESVVSACPVVNPQTLRLARRIADRHICTLSQVLSLAIPARHAATEKAVLKTAQSLVDTPVTHNDFDESPWQEWNAGPALIEHLSGGGSPRAVWTALAHYKRAQLACMVQATLASQRSVLIVVPTSWQAQEISENLAQDTGFGIDLTGSDVAAATRYQVHLTSLQGQTRIVVGTRSAVWTPLQSLGLIVVWDDADDRLVEQRAPRCDALDVAVARSHLEDCALVCGAYSRSIKAQALVQSGWAASLVPNDTARHLSAPKIHVHGEAEADREGPSGYSRLPSAALRMIRNGLKVGPVLVQVANAGYVPAIRCGRCHKTARCPQCAGQLSMSVNGTITCTWCSREATQWRCQVCSSTKLRAVRVGSERTAEELARNLSDVSILESSSTHRITRHILDKPQVVVATAGAEPQATNGYEAVLVLDAQAIAGRPELWAPQEALRRWFNAFSLLAPGRHGMIIGQIGSELGQAMVRWDPVDAAQRLLDEREALRFFPATTIIALDGPSSQVLPVVAQIDAPILGTVDRKDPATGQAFVRCLVRVEKAQSLDLLKNLAQIQRTRASRKMPVIKMTVNPPELF